jgi:hypothetical protein
MMGSAGAFGSAALAYAASGSARKRLAQSTSRPISAEE